MQEEPKVEPFSEFEEAKKIRRRKLLPWWMKVFIWIFILFGFMVVMSLIFGILGYQFGLALYGLETNEPYSVIGLIVIGLYALKAATALGLWFEKDWAINFGIVDAILGTVICLGIMIVPHVSNYIGPMIRLEFVFLLPYLGRLLKIKKDWEVNG